MDHKQKCKYRKNHKLQLQRGNNFRYADIWTLGLLYCYENIDSLRKVQRFSCSQDCLVWEDPIDGKSSAQCFVNHILNVYFICFVKEDESITGIWQVFSCIYKQYII